MFVGGFRPTSTNSKQGKENPMTDLVWLAVLGGLFLLTLAYVRLCDEA